MTDVELSTLLSQLSDTAKRLNSKSDRINAILKECETRLVDMGVGLEVWLENTALTSHAGIEEDEEDGGPAREIQHQQELGFTKVNGDWCLAVRGERGTPNAFNLQDLDWSHEEEPSRLLDAGRQVRIAALKLMPQLLAEVKRAAEAALEAIDQAEKLVR